MRGSAGAQDNVSDDFGLDAAVSACPDRKLAGPSCRRPGLARLRVACIRTDPDGLGEGDALDLAWVHRFDG
ncbi:hypothetical protein [Maricaulis sp.]|uniref:hypothetical protein n=1 Tax=Maricaulis sp. TaxID=1486257 RepID=UPI0025C31A90|nr:hypothetical protein [Maricaulis sp.]